MFNLRTKIGRLRFMGLLEGTSLLLLVFIAMPLKYVYDSRPWLKPWTYSRCAVYRVCTANRYCINRIPLEFPAHYPPGAGKQCDSVWHLFSPITAY